MEYSATFDKSKENIELLLNFGANTNIYDAQGRLPIHIACVKNNLVAIQALMKNNNQTSSYTQLGNLPIHIACVNNQTEIAKELLQFNYKTINYFNKNGETPLTQSCRMKNNKVALFLLSKDADVELTRTASGWQAIHYTAKNGDVAMTEALVNAGANVNAKAKMFKGRVTPLILAIKYENYDVAKYLLDKGANLYDKGIEKNISCMGDENSIGLLFNAVFLFCCFPFIISADDPAIHTMCLCMQPTALSLIKEEAFKNYVIINYKEIKSIRAQQGESQNNSRNLDTNNKHKKVVAIQPKNIHTDTDVDTDRGEYSGQQQNVDRLPTLYDELFPSECL